MRRDRALASRACPVVRADDDDEFQHKLLRRQLLCREEIELLLALPASEAHGDP